MRYTWLLVVAACGSSGPSDNDGGATDAGNGADVSPNNDAAGNGDVATDSPAQDSGTGGTPLSIPGVAVWLRADHVTTDTSGNVAVWPDMTSNHNDFTPSGGHPAVLASAANGKPAVDMTIISTCTGHANTVGTGPVLVEIVAGSLQKNWSVMTATSAAGNTLEIGTSTNGSARAWEATTSPVATASSGVVVNDGQFHLLGAQVASSQISLRSSGALVGGPTSGATLDLGKLDTTNIGGDAVAELVVVVGAISGTDLSALESYLKTRYAL